MPMKPVDNPRLYRQVARQIVQNIEAGIYKPGQRLPAERALANLFQVSRSSIREALIVLETENRIEIRGGSGVYVAAECARPAPLAPLSVVHSAPGAFEVFQGRDLIEPEVAALAAMNAQDSHIEGMQDALIKMVCCAPDDPAHLVYDRQFHLCLAEACGNGALYLAVETLWGFRTDSSYTAMQQTPQSSPDWQASILEHRAILVAVKNRDACSARTAMLQHLKRAKIRLSAARDASNSPCQAILANG